MNDVVDFLKSVVTCTQGQEHHAYMKLLIKDQPIQYVCWKDVLGGDVPTTLAPPSDTFFSPHLYDSPSGSLLTTHTVAIDTGEADLAYLPLTPTVVVDSSPGRTQSYFVFESPIDEFVQSQIATSVDDSDLTSTELGHLMRLPNSLNTKYSKVYGAPHRVRVAKTTRIIHKIENLIPSPNGIHEFDPNFDAPDPSQLNPIRMIEALELSARTTAEYTETTRDPRASLIRLINELLRKGISKGIILALAKASHNNYTTLFEYHQDQELKLLILKQAAKVGQTDPREKIQQIREAAVTLEIRRESIARHVKEVMRLSGEFSHLRDGTMWYIPHSKQPIHINHRGNKLTYYLDREFGLNASDIDAPYVARSLESFVDGLPKVGTGATLSFYDSSAQRLLVNTGANNIWCITPQGITQIPNGSFGVTLFPMDDIFIPFMPRQPTQLNTAAAITTQPLQQQQLAAASQPTSQHWSYILFGPILDRVWTLEPEETRAILSAWLLFLFFKNEAASRPLLAMLGAPGSGKSTIMKRVCNLIYGKVSGFMSLSNRDDFDQVTSTYPLVVIDNLDTWEKWIPDALAQSAGAIDRGKRKQYTDNELFIYHRDAIVCLTAHDPKFGRADVADRLLILPMKRLDTFIAEGELVRVDRAGLWAGMFDDLQRVLNTPKPILTTQLRIMDFSSIGSWIASALNLQVEFESAIIKLKGQQRTFALESDQLLVSALLGFVEAGKHLNEPILPAQLFLWLEQHSKDMMGFQRKYRNGQTLSNKLLATQDALKAIVDISWETDPLNRRLWRISPKP